MARSRTRARLPVFEGGGSQGDESDERPPGPRRRRRASSPDTGTVRDLAPERSERRRERMATGRAINLDIAPAFDPGFIDTEFINRTAFMYGFQFVWDPAKRHWRPLMTTDLFGSAYAQGLLADTISESLGTVLGSQNGLTTDANGDLILDPNSTGDTQLSSATGSVVGTSGGGGIRFTLKADYSSLTFNLEPVTNPPTRARVTENFGAFRTFEFAVGHPEAVIEHAWQGGGDYSLLFDDSGGAWDRWIVSSPGYPIETPEMTVTGGTFEGSGSTADLYCVRSVGEKVFVQEGTATTAFATPERATRYQRALFDPKSNGGNVRVDLYSGDPSSPDAELLARDIDPREPIQDIPPSKGPLQYKYTMERAPDGTSPKVSMSGIQYER